MLVDAGKVWFEELDLFDQTVLFIGERIDRRTVPLELFAYDIRDDGYGNVCEMATYVFVNHWGTVLSKKPIEMTDGNTRPIAWDDYGYTGETFRLDDWLARKDK